MNIWQPGVSLEQIERETILSALRFFHGNRTHAASSLGISVRTILNKIQRYKEQGHNVPESTYNVVTTQTEEAKGA